MVKIIAIILGLYLCQQSFYYTGIYEGYGIGVARFGNICYPRIGSLCLYDVDPYSGLANTHVYINWLLSFFIIGNLIKKEVVSQIISLPSALLTFLLFISVYFFKSRYVSDEVVYINLIRETLSTDFIHIWIALALLIYQIVTAIQYYFDRKPK